MKQLVLVLSLLVHLSASAQSLREIYQEGIQAYEEKDYQLFKEKMYTIDTMRPNYPPVVYNLASGYALSGEPDQALTTLNKYILMDASQNLIEENDFASLTNMPGFTQIVEKQAKLSQEISVKKSYEFPLLEAHPECIAYDEKSNSFYLGGVRDGNIWVVEEGKAPSVWMESPYSSWSVMGIEISNDGKTLWVCTSAMDNFQSLKEEDKGKVSILKYDFEKKDLLETFVLPPSHNFGDLILDSKNNVYVSDGTGNQLYWISSETGNLELHQDFSGTIFNLQGLTLTKDEKKLYLSDYIDGIYQYDLESRKTIKLTTPNTVLLKGIDGLYFQNNSLIGLHNGTTPNRVVRYDLDETGTEIISHTIIAQGGQLGEPTQAVRIGGKLHYISNSPWPMYDRDGNFNVSEGNIIIGEIE